jgi:hypothetical protein
MRRFAYSEKSVSATQPVVMCLWWVKMDNSTSNFVKQVNLL